LQAGGEYVVTLFNDPTYLVGSEIASGSGTIGNLFQLAEENASGVTARIRLDGAGASANGIIIPTFALDVDVFKNQNDAAAMPGYDPDYGLAMFHAAAMRRIMTSDLPSALPDLYRNSGLSAFVPFGSAVTVTRSFDHRITGSAPGCAGESSEVAFGAGIGTLGRIRGNGGCGAGAIRYGVSGVQSGERSESGRKSGDGEYNFNGLLYPRMNATQDKRECFPGVPR
jgi:hypothetical protein